MVPESVVTCQLDPADDAYWTDQPVMSTAAVPALYSSMKSFLYVAPLLPPPPYTCEMTTPEADARGRAVKVTTSARHAAASTAARQREFRRSRTTHLPQSFG